MICKKCGGTNHYWLASKHQFQCKNCRFRTTLQSGTILEGCKLPVSYFFIALHLLRDNNNNLTALEFQQQTRHKYIDPLYDFLKRLKAMSKQKTKIPFSLVFLEVASKVLYA